MNQAPMSRREYRRLWAHDPRYGRRYIESLRARVEHEGGGYLLRTNSAGFRCRHEFTPGRSAGRQRVLLFGNSFTAGTGVSDGARWGDRLERMLGDIEIYNFAIAGSGLDEQLLVHRCHGAGLDYDLAVIGLWTDTIYRVTARYALLRADDDTKWYRPKAYFTLGQGGSLDLHNVPVLHAAIRQDELPAAQQRFVPEPADRHCNVEDYKSAVRPGPRLLEAVVRKFCAELADRVLIVLLPPFRHVEGLADSGPTHQWMARFAVGDVTVHDPLPVLMDRPHAARRALRFPVDYHPTAAYHEIVADTVRPVLDARLRKTAV